jgi:hypothetical protein
MQANVICFVLKNVKNLCPQNGFILRTLTNLNKEMQLRLF